MIVFVGDCPSRLNKDPKVPFIGSKSYPVLLSWIGKVIKNDNYLLTNSHTDKELSRVSKWHNKGAKIVALGNNANKRLLKMNIKHFKLPHPSPRNRKLNDQVFVDLELEKCKNYIER